MNSLSVFISRSNRQSLRIINKLSLTTTMSNSVVVAIWGILGAIRLEQMILKQLKINK